MSPFQKTIIPFSIIIAGACIAFAIFYSGSHQAVVAKPTPQTLTDIANQYVAGIVVDPVTAADHIRGNPDAKVTIIEYSDTECPFCKQFHQVLEQISQDYGTSSTQVAWVYRHFPIPDLHTKAPKEAEATECANELGGPDIFWNFLDTVFDVTPSNDGLDPSRLVTIADQVGLDTTAFSTCVNSGKYATKIQEAEAAGKRAGAQATPYTILLVKNGTKTETVPLIDAQGQSLGALPYDAMKAIVEKLLNS